MEIVFESLHYTSPSWISLSSRDIVPLLLLGCAIVIGVCSAFRPAFTITVNTQGQHSYS
jgi:hypothetical protein